MALCLSGASLLVYTVWPMIAPVAVYALIGIGLECMMLWSTEVRLKAYQHESFHQWSSVVLMFGLSAVVTGLAELD